MFCIMIVLPAFGGDTIRPRWPLPNGATRSITRAVMSSVVPLPRSILYCLSANSGVRFSKLTLRLETRSEEHTSELQSLMRISYAVFCLKKKNHHYFDNVLLPI